MSRGQMVPLPTRTYDPQANPRSPSYDPNHNDHGHITGRPEPDAPKER